MSVVTDLVAPLVVLLCRTVLGVVTSLAIIAVGPVLVGMTSTVVMSDSMSPGIRAGDVVVVRPVPTADIRLGQVLLVDDQDFPGRLRLHRLVGQEGDGFVLQGDANAQADSARVAPRAVHGVGFLRVPWIGLPLLWMRSGRVPLTMLALAGFAAVAACIAVLDPGGRRSGRAPISAVRRGAAAGLGVWRRLRRSRPGGAALAVLLVAGATSVSTSETTPTWAAFSGTTSSTGNSLQTGTWACPAVPSPSPDVLYSFMAASGTDEPNRSDTSKTASSASVLSSDSLRVTGTCAANASPYLRFSGKGGETLISTTRLAAAAPGTQTIWFSPTAATGLVQGVGAATGATDRASARAADRQLYFTSAGQLAFAMRDGSGITACSLRTAISLKEWHFAAVTYASDSLTFTLTLDGGVVTCSATLGTAPSGTPYLRFGSDVMIASDASTGAYQGGIDEPAAWTTVLTDTQLKTVRANGH